MPNLNTTNFASAIKVQYENRLLNRALPRLIHGRWLTEARLTKNGSYEMRKYAGLSAVTTALSEAATPAEQSAPSLSTVTISPTFYGAWIGYNDIMELEMFDPYISETSGILGEQAGLSADTIVRDYLIANGTVDYSNDKSAVGSLDAPADNISYRDFLIQMASFETANGLPPDGMNGRTPVIIHPHSYATLMLDPVFVNLFTKESDPLRSGYVGYLLNYEFYITSNAYEAADVGAGSTTDVYGLVFMGKDSIGVVGFSGTMPDLSGDGGDKDFTGTGKKVSPVEIIGKPLGSSGSADPLNQRGTLGWKMNLGLGTMNSDWIRVVKHTNIFSDV